MTTLVDGPVRVDGVQLIGEMVGSGYRTPPALVRRNDGQVLQLTPLLYLVLEASDGGRGWDEVAEEVGARMQRRVSADDVRTLVDGHLRPLGLVRPADGSEPELRRSNPLLALKLKVSVTDPRTTHRLTDPFRVLFRPVVAAVVVLAFAAVLIWVFFERGLGASAYDAFDRPHLLLLVFVMTVLSGGFHEFGHAAAARYSGAEPGVMGAGLYLVWPAFYTDVTDSYRLGRAGRIRTDLGGLYFNAIVAVLTFGWWWVSGWEALLLLVATQVLQMVQQLLPLLRFDGYHLLADLAGVPDLYQRIRPTLLGLLPHRWSSPENRVLTPWARVVITLWVLVTVPLMGLMLYALVTAVPRMLGSAGSAVRADTEELGAAWSTGTPIDVAAHVLQVLSVVLPVVACALILGRMGLRWFRGLAGWSRGSAPKRVLAAALSTVMLTGLAWAWWPAPDTYRPIEPDERGLLTTLLQDAPAAGLARAAADLPEDDGPPPGTAARKRLSDGRPLVAMLPEGGTVPTKDDPELAMVLVPTSDGAGEEPGTDTGAEQDTPIAGEPTDVATDGTDSAPDDVEEVPATDGAVPDDDTWVMPFDKPLAPEEGDNQALAVNTTDGSVTYDLAFALIWADGDEVYNGNEAHAYASCSDCVAVAVAFQVVLISEDAQVVVPQNLAVAANYDCYQCITAAIANQLVLTVPGEPGEAQLRALGEVWGRLLEFAQGITGYTLTEIDAQLEAFKAEIVGILGEAPVIEPAPSATTSPGESPSESESPSTTPSVPSSTPSPTPSTTPTTPAPTTTTPSAPTSSTPPAPTTSSTTTSPSTTGTTTSPGTTSSTTSPSASSSASPSTSTSSASPSPSSTTSGAVSPSAGATP